MSALLSYVTLLSLAVAASLDVGANLLLVESRGFRRKLPGFGALVLVGLAFYTLSRSAGAAELPVLYALWGGFGVLGTALGGCLLFGQKLRLSAWAGIVLVVGGMIVLNMS